MPSVLWQCSLGSRKGIRPVKTEWWDAGVVICLGQGADSHMTQLMPLPFTVSCSSKCRLVLFFWYRLTRVVLDKGPVNGCCCCLLLHASNEIRGCGSMLIITAVLQADRSTVMSLCVRALLLALVLLLSRSAGVPPTGTVIARPSGRTTPTWYCKVVLSSCHSKYRAISRMVTGLSYCLSSVHTAPLLSSPHDAYKYAGTIFTWGYTVFEPPNIILTVSVWFK